MNIFFKTPKTHTQIYFIIAKKQVMILLDWFYNKTYIALQLITHINKNTHWVTKKKSLSAQLNNMSTKYEDDKIGLKEKKVIKSFRSFLFFQYDFVYKPIPNRI